MGLPIQLDEYDDSELEEEISRREEQRKAGRCDYCGRFWGEPACKFPLRHAEAKPIDWSNFTE